MILPRTSSRLASTCALFISYAFGRVNSAIHPGNDTTNYKYVARVLAIARNNSDLVQEVHIITSLLTYLPTKPLPGGGLVQKLGSLGSLLRSKIIPLS